MERFYILLVFTQLFMTRQFTYSFRFYRSQLQTSTGSPAIQDDKINTLSYNCGGDCGCLSCNFTLPAPKKIINPYKEELSNFVPQKPFGSFCIKCIACLAVAHEIENVIISSSEECETDPEKKKGLLQVIVKEVDNLCAIGFKKFVGFNLRMFGNHSVITNRFKCTKHIISKMDGNWAKKLRELCTLYVSKINVEDISIQVLDSMGNLTDIMCRGTGIFRDCSNIKGHENLTMPSCDDCDC